LEKKGEQLLATPAYPVLHYVTKKTGAKALVPEVIVTLSQTFSRESNLKDSAPALFLVDGMSFIGLEVRYVGRLSWIGNRIYTSHRLYSVVFTIDDLRSTNSGTTFETDNQFPNTL